MSLKIRWDLGAGDTGKFAASELEHGIAQMCPQALQDQGGSVQEKVIELNLGFPLSPGKDPFWDDGYSIDVQDGQGTIMGSNPRSLLLAVYRLLTEAGCAFLRPGESYYQKTD